MEAHRHTWQRSQWVTILMMAHVDSMTLPSKLATYWIYLKAERERDKERFRKSVRRGLKYSAGQLKVTKGQQKLA